MRMAIGQRPFLSFLNVSGATFIDDANENGFFLVKQIQYFEAIIANLHWEVLVKHR